MINQSADDVYATALLVLQTMKVAREAVLANGEQKQMKYKAYVHLIPGAQIIFQEVQKKFVIRCGLTVVHDKNYSESIQRNILKLNCTSIVTIVIFNKICRVGCCLISTHIHIRHT